MNLRRLVTVFLLSGVAVVATATPAFAHAELIASSPAQNAALDTAPQQVDLTFSEPVTPAANPVTITGPDGVSWTVGAPRVADVVVTVPVQPTGPAGAYTLTYQVVSADGDAVSGTVQFTLTTAVAAAPPTTTTTTPETTAPPPTTPSPGSAAASTEDSDGGVPVWVWILGAVVIIAAGVVVALRVARSKSS